MSYPAPNMSGIADEDRARVMYLVELSLYFAKKVLVPGGDDLVKVLQGWGCPVFVRRLRSAVAAVKDRKPKASRSRSAELYLLALQFRM